MTLYPNIIKEALMTVRYPGNGKNLIENEMLEDDLRIDGMKVSFSLIFPKATDPFKKSILKAAETAIHTYVSPDVEVTINAKAQTELPPEPDKLLPGVKNIIAVSSGKGGVGKSTVTANLAIGLAKMGYRVGLLDTDIFGPSMPKMFQVEDARPYAENIGGRDLIVPIEKYGVKLLSIGFFVDPSQATLWRGGMASNALKQLIGEALWGELDYFILDTPPGTSDIHLTLLQTLGITGAVIVSTPQEVALADARKGVNMYMNDKVNVPWTCGKYGVVHTIRASRREVLYLRKGWSQTLSRGTQCSASGTDSACSEHLRVRRQGHSFSSRPIHSRWHGIHEPCRKTCNTSG